MQVSVFLAIFTYMMDKNWKRWMLQTQILVKFIYSINIYCVPTQCKHYSRTFFPGNRKGERAWVQQCWLPDATLTMLWDKSLCFCSCILFGWPLSQQTLLFSPPPRPLHCFTTSLSPRQSATPSPPNSATCCPRNRLRLCSPRSLCNPRAPISTPTPPSPGTLPGACLCLTSLVCKIGKY